MGRVKESRFEEKDHHKDRFFLRRGNSLAPHFDSFRAIAAVESSPIGADCKGLGQESNQRGDLQEKLCDDTRQHTVCRFL